MASPRALLWAVVGLALALEAGAGCGGSREPQDPPAEARSPARTLALPERGPAAEAAAPETLVWTIPPDWAEEPPASSIRLAQYRVPGPAGDAECVVFYFGPGQGGDPASNALRWAGQFEKADGGSAADAMRLTELERTEVAVHLVEVSGTYDGGMTMTDAPAEKKPGFMLLGGIAQGADAPWFFKLTGPAATVRAQREAFLDMLRSIRPGPQ